MLMNCSIDMCSLARRKKLHLTASVVMKTVNIVTLSLPQVWITELKINTIYSKRDTSLTMYVAANYLTRLAYTDIYILFKSSHKICFFSPSDMNSKK